MLPDDHGSEFYAVSVISDHNRRRLILNNEYEVALLLIQTGFNLFFDTGRSIARLGEVMYLSAMMVV